MGLDYIVVDGMPYVTIKDLCRPLGVKWQHAHEIADAVLPALDDDGEEGSQRDATSHVGASERRGMLLRGDSVRNPGAFKQGLTSQMVDYQKTIAAYFEAQIDFFCELIYGRHYEAIELFEKIFPFDTILSILYHKSPLPDSILARFVKLTNRLYVNRFPHEENCGRQKLPDEIWVRFP